MCCLKIRGERDFSFKSDLIILNFSQAAQIPMKWNSYRNAFSKLLVRHRKDDLSARRICRIGLQF